MFHLYEFVDLRPYCNITQKMFINYSIQIMMRTLYIKSIAYVEGIFRKHILELDYLSNAFAIIFLNSEIIMLYYIENYTVPDGNT